MAFTAGTDAIIELHDGSTFVDFSAYVRTVGLSRSRDMYDTTTLGLNDRRFVGGLRNNTTTFDGPYDPISDAFLDDAIQAQARDCKYWPAGKGAGGEEDADHPVYEGQYLISSYGPSTPVDNMAQFTANVQFSGPMTRSTESS